MVVGHVATRLALDHHINGMSLEALVNADFEWRAGWEYQLSWAAARWVAGPDVRPATGSDFGV